MRRVGAGALNWAEARGEKEAAQQLRLGCSSGENKSLTAPGNEKTKAMSKDETGKGKRVDGGQAMV